mgnify:CR=1 FL=1
MPARPRAPRRGSEHVLHEVGAQGAVQGRTDYGQPGFGGAAPPPGHGPHRYIFTVFAVDTERLDVTADDSGAVFGFNLHFHTLAKASITATYENKA